MNVSGFEALRAGDTDVTATALLYLLAAAISAELALYGWHRRQCVTAMPFAALMAVVVYWSVGHALGVAGSTLDEVVFWTQVQYAGIVFVGPLWLLFALTYAGRRQVTRWQRWGVLAPALLSYVALLTNGWHRLWWIDVALDSQRPFGALDVTRGTLFWLHFAYSYTCVVAGCALLLRAVPAWRNSRRRQAGLVLTGALIPTSGNLTYILGVRAPALDDPTPFLFATSGLVLVYAALRYGFLAPQPVGRRDIAPRRSERPTAEAMTGGQDHAAGRAGQDRWMFLAAVSHELRTPLTSIIGYTDLLARGIFGALPQGASEPLGHIRHSSLTALRLVNDLLDISKIETGHFTVHVSEVDLGAVIREVAGAMQPQVAERGLELRIELAHNIPPVLADPERIEQVLINLVANAVKFTDQGSVTIGAALAGERVRFSVVDTGIGIAPEQQALLFQAFHQIDSPHTRRFSGTGLGLAISRRLMELMGGALDVTSAPGAGSTFYGDLQAATGQLRERARGAE